MTTREQIAELRTLMAKATPGPWTDDKDDTICGPEWDVGVIYGTPCTKEDAALIPAMRNALPGLLEAAGAGIQRNGSSERGASEVQASAHTGEPREHGEPVHDAALISDLRAQLAKANTEAAGIITTLKKELMEQHDRKMVYQKRAHNAEDERDDLAKRLEAVAARCQRMIVDESVLRFALSDLKAKLAIRDEAEQEKHRARLATMTERHARECDALQARLAAVHHQEAIQGTAYTDSRGLHHVVVPALEMARLKSELDDLKAKLAAQKPVKAPLEPDARGMRHGAWSWLNEREAWITAIEAAGGTVVE